MITSYSTMTIKDLLARYPRAVQVFVNLRMLCAGCPTEAFHTVADVARIHHYPLKDLVERIEKAIEEKDAF